MACRNRHSVWAACSFLRRCEEYSRPHFMPQADRRPELSATMSRQRLAHSSHTSLASRTSALSQRKPEAGAVPALPAVACAPSPAFPSSIASSAAPIAPVRWQNGDTWIGRPRCCSNAATSAGFLAVAPWNTM